MSFDPIDNFESVVRRLERRFHPKTCPAVPPRAPAIEYSASPADILSLQLSHRDPARAQRFALERPPLLTDAVVRPKVDDDVEKRRENRHDLVLSVDREPVVDHAVGSSHSPVSEVDKPEHAFSAVRLEQGEQRVDPDPKLGGLEPVRGGFERLDRARDLDPEVGERLGGRYGNVDRRRRFVAARGGAGASDVDLVPDDPVAVRGRFVDERLDRCALAGRRNQNPSSRTVRGVPEQSATGLGLLARSSRPDDEDARSAAFQPG